MAYLRFAAPALLVFAIPNEGMRAPRSGATMKRRGMLPGIPDLCLISPGGMSFFLEVKTEAGRLNANQKNISAFMAAHAIPRATVRSVANVEVALKQWGLI